MPNTRLLGSSKHNDHQRIKDTTLEIGPELGLDVAWQATIVVLAGVRKKRFEMPVHKTVENGLGRTAGQIRGGERGHGAVPFADRVPPSAREFPPALEGSYLSWMGAGMAADPRPARRCGVRVFSYVDGDFAGIGGAGLLVTTVKGVVAEGTRRSNNQNIRAALRRRAEMGRATHILTNPVYRGVVKHGRTRFVERRGTRVVERAPDSEIVTVQRPDLALWNADLIEKVDALLSSNRRKPFGPATPKHLASSFVRCVHCGSAIVCLPSRRRRAAAYTCNKMLQHGKAAGIGIGYRSENAVDRALLDAIKPFVAGPVAKRAMEILAARIATLSEPDGIDAERERIARVLADAERKATKLASAIGEAENNEFLIEQLRTETKRVEVLRAELTRLTTQRPDELSGGGCSQR